MNIFNNILGKIQSWANSYTNYMEWVGSNIYDAQKNVELKQQWNVIQSFLNEAKDKPEMVSKRNAVISMLQNWEEDNFIENTITKQMGYDPSVWLWWRIVSALWNRLATAGESYSTNKSGVEKWLSAAKDVIATPFDIIWAVAQPAIQPIAETVMKTPYIGTWVKEIWKQYWKFRESNPRLAQNIEAVTGIATAVAPFTKTGQAVSNTIQNTGKEIWKQISLWISKLPEWVSNLASNIVQVPKKIVRSWVDTLERIKPWVKDMLVDIDPQSKYAVERSTPKEISKIIEDAKNAKIDPRADYQQTPYHKGAEMANKTVNTIDENLKKRQSERMAILENVPMEKVDLNYSRNTLKSELDKLNIENITIDESWKPVVVPKKWRSALLDQNNPQDMQAIQKLWEILRDDVSPLQTMDNIKILQEWLYENKWTIALKGISKKMDWLVSKVQSSLNKTFKDQLPPEYRKVMDSMSEDMKMSQDMKRLFWIGDDGMPVWNKWELIMKRLTNWTTTWGEARILAEKILKKYGIDLIKEARLRQLSMELVWDTRWANLFWAVLSGKKWMMDWAMWKIGDTMIDKESLIKSYAWKWKIVKPKKQPNLYTKPKKNVWNSNNSNTPINTEWSKKVNTPLNFKSSNNYK